MSKSDLRATLPKSLGAFGAVGEQIEERVLRESVGEGTEPHLESGVGSVFRGDLQAAGVSARDAHRGAVQVVADHPHLLPNDFGVERLARSRAGAQKAGVEVDALAS